MWFDYYKDWPKFALSETKEGLKFGHINVSVVHGIVSKVLFVCKATENVIFVMNAGWLLMLFTVTDARCRRLGWIYTCLFRVVADNTHCRCASLRLIVLSYFIFIFGIGWVFNKSLNTLRVLCLFHDVDGFLFIDDYRFAGCLLRA